MISKPNFATVVQLFFTDRLIYMLSHRENLVLEQEEKS